MRFPAPGGGATARRGSEAVAEAPDSLPACAFLRASISSAPEAGGAAEERRTSVEAKMTMEPAGDDVEMVELSEADRKTAWRAKRRASLMSADDAEDKVGRKEAPGRDVSEARRVSLETRRTKELQSNVGAGPAPATGGPRLPPADRAAIPPRPAVRAAAQVGDEQTYCV